MANQSKQGSTPVAQKADPRRWEYPDGTPTTKEQRAHFEEHGELPPQPEPDADAETDEDASA